MERSKTGRKQAHQSNRLGHSGQWLLIALLLLLLAGLLWAGNKWARTSRNLAAMIVTPAPTRNLQPTRNAPLLAARPMLNPGNITPSSTPTAPPIVSTGVIRHPPTPTAIPTIPTVTSSPTAAPTSQGAVTVLLLGGDQRPGEQRLPRTDSVLLLRLEPQTGRIALLSLPRDLMVNVPGYGTTRINNAYAWGESYGTPGGGLELARSTVSGLVGVPVDYVALIDFEGFSGLVDSIGGITVHVRKELHDERFPTMDYAYSTVHFNAGPQWMDGATTLIYTRIRHPDNDFKRILRQQDVLVAIGKRLHERGDLRNFAAADAITGALRDYVRSTIPQPRLVELVWALRNTNPQAIERYAVTPDMISFGYGDDPYAEVPRPGAIELLVQAWYGW